VATIREAKTTDIEEESAMNCTRKHRAAKGALEVLRQQKHFILNLSLFFSLIKNDPLDLK
jgi:hypothetical protein